MPLLLVKITNYRVISDIYTIENMSKNSFRAYNCGNYISSHVECVSINETSELKKSVKADLSLKLNFFLNKKNPHLTQIFTVY